MEKSQTTKQWFRTILALFTVEMYSKEIITSTTCPIIINSIQFKAPREMQIYCIVNAKWQLEWLGRSDIPEFLSLWFISFILYFETGFIQSMGCCLLKISEAGELLLAESINNRLYVSASTESLSVLQGKGGTAVF